MKPADTERIEAFLEKWLGSQGDEQSNSQTFFNDFCRALGVEEPPPKNSVPGNPYCFEKGIKVARAEGADTTKRADFYKEAHFIIEAKQGGEGDTKGTAKRGTKAYRDAMQRAFWQVRRYAIFAPGQVPPFVMTCDIGSHFELWEGWSSHQRS